MGCAIFKSDAVARMILRPDFFSSRSQARNFLLHGSVAASTATRNASCCFRKARPCVHQIKTETNTKGFFFSRRASSSQSRSVLRSVPSKSTQSGIVVGFSDGVGGGIAMLKRRVPRPNAVDKRFRFESMSDLHETIVGPTGNGFSAGLDRKSTRLNSSH